MPVRLALLAALPWMLAGCDGYGPPLSSDSFRMRVDGEEVVGRAVLVTDRGAASLTRLVLTGAGGTLHIQSEALVSPEVGPVAPLIVSYSRPSDLYPYKYRRGEVRVTGAVGAVVEGDFDLVLRTYDGLLFQFEVRVRGTFRVTR